jgi:hypothetical protein
MFHKALYGVTDGIEPTTTGITIQGMNQKFMQVAAEFVEISSIFPARLAMNLQT